MWLGEMYHEAREEACQHENMKICLQDDNERLRAEVLVLRELLELSQQQTVTLMCEDITISAIKQEEQSDE